MIDKKIDPFSLTNVVAALMVMLLCGNLVASFARTSVTGRKETALKLEAKYNQNLLEDISTDGRLLLFYQTTTPIRSYTIPRGGGRVKANQPPVNDDVLRVVERESGREIGRVRVVFFPSNAQFIPDTQLIFYKEPTSNRQKYSFKIWNFTTGEAKVCSDEDALNFRYATVRDSRYVIGAVLQKNGGEMLGKLMLPDCSVTVTESVNPSDSESTSRGGFNLSHDAHFLAYVISDEIVIRDAATLNIVRRVKPPSGLIFGDSPIYTPDSKFFLVVASNTIFDNLETKRFLLLYDTTNYEVARQLDITDSSPPRLRESGAVSSPLVVTAMAVSPDNRLLAVGYTKEERKALSTIEQAQVTLYDLMTGNKVARALHPPIKQQRNDPFIAKIGKLSFTPDGKYLLSSTHDTYIWVVDRTTLLPAAKKQDFMRIIIGGFW